MSSTKLVPFQLDEQTLLYIEAQENSAAPPVEMRENETPAERRRGGQKGRSGPIPASGFQTAQSLRTLPTTIRAYTAYCLNAFKNFGAAKVDEVTLEFGVNLSADGGIPYIASGKAESNLKITVRCSYNK